MDRSPAKEARVAQSPASEPAWQGSIDPAPKPRGGELRCAECDYDLLGSLDVGRCPECGTPIPPRDSGTLARFGGEAWLRRAERGLRLWGRAVTATLLLALAGIPLSSLGSRTVAGIVVFALWLCAFGGCICVAAYGLWTISARHPVIDRAERMTSPRRAVRMALVCSFLVVVVSVIRSLWAPSSPWDGILELLGALSVCAAGLTGALGLVERVGQLCRLVGDSKAARRARFVGIPFSITWGIVFAVAFVARGAGLDLPGVFALLWLATVCLGLFTLLTPSYLAPHLRAALTELARESSRGTFAPTATAGEVDNIASQSSPPA